MILSSGLLLWRFFLWKKDHLPPFLIFVSFLFLWAFQVWFRVWIRFRIRFWIQVQIRFRIRFRFWQSYFIRLFAASLQCEFIRTFFYKSHSYSIHNLNLYSFVVTFLAINIMAWMKANNYSFNFIIMYYFLCLS